MTNEISIREINPISIEGGIIINGFPSSGITSAIATESLINTSSLNLGAVIDSDRFPPISMIKNGIPPFWEKGSKKLLKICLKKKTLSTHIDYKSLKKSKFIIICIGTPIDQKLRPKIKEFLNFFYFIKKLINKSQIIVIRSSIFPLCSICE